MAADGAAQARADLEPASGRHHPELLSLLESLRPLAVDAAGFFALQRRIFALRVRVRAFLAEYDALVCPITSGPPPLHGHWPGESVGIDSYEGFNYTHAFSLAGLPAVSVPAGSENGLPIGVQVVAAAFSDHVALAVAAVIEERIGGFRAIAHRRRA
jgi:Asp-tRNA(Asn)/Glu-tRNA(Gln) amidotransferase A subunit family amidase